MERSAPETGYSFGNKRDYRRRVWCTFRNDINRRRSSKAAAAEAHVLLMPSAEGDEVRVAISKGFREENIHAVDNNPALLAVAKKSGWRKRFPKVQIYGVELPRACEIMMRKGIRLAAANLDLCGPSYSRPMGEAIAGAVASGVFEDRALSIAITMLRGRERGADFNARILLDDMSPELESLRLAWCTPSRPFTCTDLVRLRWAADTLADGFARREPGARSLMTIRLAGSYRSTAGNQTMLWALFEIVPPRALEILTKKLAEVTG